MSISYRLAPGSHASPKEGLCALEWVAYIAGEEHSDSPVCVDPVLRRFGIGLNDAMPDEIRQRLRPYLARMIGTAGDGRSKERRWKMADWAIHHAAPLAQEAIGREDLAEKLRAAPKVVDRKSGEKAAEIAREVWAANYAAANAADAANAANAAYHAAATTTAAAADAADAAAYAYAARSAMWERLWPSIADLLEAMLPTEAIDLPEPAAAEYERLLEVA